VWDVPSMRYAFRIYYVELTWPRYIPYNSVPQSDAFTCIWGTLKVIIVPGSLDKIDRGNKKCSHSEQPASTRERLASLTYRHALGINTIERVGVNWIYRHWPRSVFLSSPNAIIGKNAPTVIVIKGQNQFSNSTQTNYWEAKLNSDPKHPTLSKVLCPGLSRCRAAARHPSKWSNMANMPKLIIVTARRSYL
jgi:hypothetical protein